MMRTNSIELLKYELDQADKALDISVGVLALSFSFAIAGILICSVNLIAGILIIVISIPLIALMWINKSIAKYNRDVAEKNFRAALKVVKG